jgi:hypothetical protein
MDLDGLIRNENANPNYMNTISIGPPLAMRD